MTLRRFCDGLVTPTSCKEVCMSVASHITELQRKHRALSEAVEAAQRNPGVDDLEIARMKREKLRLKEEISRLSPVQ